MTASAHALLVHSRNGRARPECGSLARAPHTQIERSHVHRSQSETQFTGLSPRVRARVTWTRTRAARVSCILGGGPSAEGKAEIASAVLWRAFVSGVNVRSLVWSDSARQGNAIRCRTAPEPTCCLVRFVLKQHPPFRRSIPTHSVAAAFRPSGAAQFPPTASRHALVVAHLRAVRTAQGL